MYSTPRIDQVCEKPSPGQGADFRAQMCTIMFFALNIPSFKYDILPSLPMEVFMFIQIYAFIKNRHAS